LTISIETREILKLNDTIEAAYDTKKALTESLDDYKHQNECLNNNISKNNCFINFYNKNANEVITLKISEYNQLYSGYGESFWEKVRTLKEHPTQCINDEI